VTEIALAIVIAMLLAYHGWKDVQHRRQIDRLSVLLKAKDVPEFIAGLPAIDPKPTKEQEPQDDLVPLEEATPEEALAALRNTTTSA
jgi:hypothetical protein